MSQLHLNAGPPQVPVRIAMPVPVLTASRPALPALTQGKARCGFGLGDTSLPLPLYLYLYPIPSTLYPIPYTLYPVLYTLYSIPYTLYLCPILRGWPTI